MAMCLPVRTLRKSCGRDFIRDARWNNDSTSMGDKSRIETRSLPGIVVIAGCGAVGAASVWLLTSDSFRTACVFLGVPLYPSWFLIWSLISQALYRARAPPHRHAFSR